MDIVGLFYTNQPFDRLYDFIRGFQKLGLNDIPLNDINLFKPTNSLFKLTNFFFLFFDNGWYIFISKKFK